MHVFYYDTFNNSCLVLCPCVCICSAGNVIVITMIGIHHQDPTASGNIEASETLTVKNNVIERSVNGNANGSGNGTPVAVVERSVPEMIARIAIVKKNEAVDMTIDGKR